MENKNIFHSFNYVVGNDFIYQDKVVVKVFYLYKNINIVKNIDIKKKANAPESYYRDEAKKIINQLIKSGELEKYSKQYYKKEKRKKVLAVLIPITGACAIAGASTGIYFAVGGNPSVTPIVYHTIKFSDSSLNCKMYDVVEPYGEVTSKEWEAGEIARYKIKENYACSLPSEDQITFTTDDGKAFDGLHSYDPSTGELSVKMTANVTITAKADYHWYLDNDNYLSKLTDNDVIKEGGEIQTLTVNGVEHKVRLIGVDKDSTDAAGEDKIHTTWEFATLLSDSDGHSLALQWDDIENDTEVSVNVGYLNSTLRKALNGTGDANHFLWAQKGATTWTQNPLYEDKTVLDMLDDGNPGLLNALKSPYKTVEVESGTEWIEKPIVNDEGKFDKLFLLSNYENASNSSIPDRIYAYYSNDAQNRRIKKQFKENESFPASDLSKIGINEGQIFRLAEITNGAGLNVIDGSSDSQYWLRSLGIGAGGTYYPVISIYTNGATNIPVGGVRNALAIAPAFCI